MDRGAFWVSKNDGADWVEHSAGLANNYIISICPSQFNPARVYLAMTGINYDDLHSYLYVSEDFGANWRSINTGLPDEPINVIREDPTNENILYAGGLRGVYISVDRGAGWSYMGINMPVVAVADLEFYLPEMDLVVGTHGRGIYKTSLKPIQKMAKEKLPLDRDHLFETGEIRRPWFNSHGGEINYRTLEKTVFTFWLSEAKPVELTLTDKAGREVWKISLSGHPGYNQYRWDLIIRQDKSDLPYFYRYNRFITAGDYTLKALFGNKLVEQEVRVVNYSPSPTL
jgi:hypothetical protein